MLFLLAYRSTAATSSVLAGAMLKVFSSTRKCSEPLIAARSSAKVCKLVESDIIEDISYLRLIYDCGLLRNIRLCLRPREGEECRDLFSHHRVEDAGRVCPGSQAGEDQRHSGRVAWCRGRARSTCSPLPAVSPCQHHVLR